LSSVRARVRAQPGPLPGRQLTTDERRWTRTSGGTTSEPGSDAIGANRRRPAAGALLRDARGCRTPACWAMHRAAVRRGRAQAGRGLPAEQADQEADGHGLLLSRRVTRGARVRMENESSIITVQRERQMIAPYLAGGSVSVMQASERVARGRCAGRWPGGRKEDSLMITVQRGRQMSTPILQMGADCVLSSGERGIPRTGWTDADGLGGAPGGRMLHRRGN